MTYLCNLYYAELLSERITALRLAQWSIKQGPDSNDLDEQEAIDQNESREEEEEEEEESEIEEDDDDQEEEEEEEEEEEPPDGIDGADADEQSGQKGKDSGRK